MNFSRSHVCNKHMHMHANKHANKHVMHVCMPTSDPR